MRRSRLHAFLTSVPAAAIAVVAAVLATACASQSQGEEPSGEPGVLPGSLPGDDTTSTAATEEELRGSCTYPRKYFVTLKSSACADIAGRRGRWVVRPLFDDASTETPVSASTCALEWEGEKWSRADREALLSSVTAEDVLTPACGEGANPVLGGLREIPYVDNWTQAGSVGCDVCGVLLSRRKLWVILPPEKTTLRQLSVEMSNGASRSFEIDAPVGARAVSVELPPAPAGLTYKTGRVHVY